MSEPKNKQRQHVVRGSWTTSEDEALSSAVAEYGAKNWKKIAEQVPGRSDVQCLHRWQKVLNPDLVKGPWTEEEDNKVRELVVIHGAKKWSLIASNLPGRIGKQCRERFDTLFLLSYFFVANTSYRLCKMLTAKNTGRNKIGAG